MTIETTPNNAPRKCGRPKTKPDPLEPSKGRRSRKLDPVKALQLRQRGHTLKEIGEKYNVGDTAVANAITRVRKIILSPEHIKEYRTKEIDLLDSARARLIVAASEPDKIKKSSTLQLTTAFCQLTDKSQLLQGKSTANVSIRSVVQDLSDRSSTLQGELDKLLSPQPVVSTTDNQGDNVP